MSSTITARSSTCKAFSVTRRCTGTRRPSPMSSSGSHGQETDAVTPQASAEMTPTGAAAYFDFSTSIDDLAGQGRPLRLHGPRWQQGQPLEFTEALQLAEMDAAG